MSSAVPTREDTIPDGTPNVSRPVGAPLACGRTRRTLGSREERTVDGVETGLKGVLLAGPVGLTGVPLTLVGAGTWLGGLLTLALGRELWLFERRSS